MALRESDAYAPAAFREGLRRLGYSQLTNCISEAPDSDLVVAWNRQPREEHAIAAAERRGARVLIAENGYIGRDADGGKLFALARNHHSGAGDWPVGGPERWRRLGVELAPWRDDGDDVVVLAQRSIGERGIAQPEGWAEQVARQLAAATRRRVRVRPHPGAQRTDPYDDLRGAWAAVTWASGAGIKSLVAGIPVFHGLPSWIGAGAAAPLELDNVEFPAVGDRLPMFERLAWAQWTRAEIASGEALEWLGA